MTLLVRFGNQLRANWKWALSFLSPDWKLEDYPISIRKQAPDPDGSYDDNPRFKLHPYVASITNWNVVGLGDSKEEALSNLRSAFASRKAKLKNDGTPLPRPGTKVPIQFVSQERVNVHPDLTKDFIERVLGFEWAFISDESNLWDFHTDSTNEVLLVKIKEIYGVNVEDIQSARVWEILDRIAEAQRFQ
jgi:hypothetical protein